MYLYSLYRWVKCKCILYINDRAGADNFRIVDIKFLAWSSFFHLIRLFSSLVCILKIKFNQSEWRMQNPKQPISSREIWSLRAILWENSRWSTGKDIGRPVKISQKGGKERIKQKSKVSTVDIHIKGSVLRVSDSKVFSSGGMYMHLYEVCLRYQFEY